MRARGLKELLGLCRERGDAIEIIFPGGIDQLTAAALDDLQHSEFEYR